MLTAIVVPFHEASPIVDGWRERTCADRPSIGIPPHVTLLFPFMPAEQVDEGLLDELRELFAAEPAFEVAFRELRGWPGMAYLAPDPPDPFARLTGTIVDRWPDHPPYEGAHDEAVPHMTVAYGDDTLLAEVEADVCPNLPIETKVAEAVLLEELEPHWGRWGERARFRLGGGARG